MLSSPVIDRDGKGAREFMSRPVTTRLQPLWTTTLDPIENSGAPRTQRWHILGQKQQAERKHPDAEDRQEKKQTSEDQQQACGNAEPPAGRLAQEAHVCSKRGWQAIDEFRQAVIIVSRFV
jgi:hypothetical protein